MFYAEIFVGHCISTILGIEDNLVESRLRHHLAAAGALRQATEFAFYHLLNPRDVGSDFL